MGKGSRARIQRSEQKTAVSETKKNQQKKSRIGLVSGIVCAILAVFVVVALVLGAIKDSGVGIRKTIGITSDNYEVNNAMTSYYFRSIYQNYLTTYSDYLQYIGLDTSKSLKAQEAYTGTTWFNYFMDSTKSQLRQLVSMANAAKAEGLELDADDEAALKTLASNLKSRAASAGMTYPVYLKTAFGNGVTEEVVMDSVRLELLANKYYTKYTESLSYSDADYEKYYNDHAEDFQAVNYKMYKFSVETGEDVTDEEYDAEYDKVKGYAEQLNAATSEAEFDDILRAILKEQGKTEEEVTEAIAATNLTATSKSATEGEWLFAEERTAGDKQVTEAGTAITAYYLVEPAHRNDAVTRNFRRILIAESEDLDNAAAKAKAEEILATFQAGEKTGDAFGKLADENSYDTTEGGLYENYQPSATPTTEIDKWLSDESRKAGDVEIVVNADYGYDILFYEGDGMPVWQATAKTELMEQDFNKQIDTLAETYHFTCKDDVLDKIDA